MDEKSFLRKSVETVAITELSTFTIAIVGGGASIIWNAAINQDKAIKDATAEIVATQAVFSEEIERIKEQNLLLTDSITLLTEQLRVSPLPLSSLKPKTSPAVELERFSTEQMARPPVQEILRAYKK